MKDNNLEEDLLLKMLCDDIYITHKYIHDPHADMYITARQTSQGRQRSYNINTTFSNDTTSIRVPALRKNRGFFRDIDDSQQPTLPLYDDLNIEEFNIDDYVSGPNISKYIKFI